MYYTEYMLKSNKKHSFKKLLIGILIFCVVGFLLFLYYFFHLRQLTDYSKDIPADADKVVYQEKLSFDPETLTDITQTETGIKILDSFNSQQMQASIPAKSKITIPMASYCIDGDKKAPDINWPNVFSYEKVDMPMYADLIAYLRKHPNVDQDLVQQIIWHLAPDYQMSYDDLSDDEKTLLLTINPSTQKIIDSYQYFQDYDIKYFQFPKNLPKQVVAQNIPGTKLYAKGTEFYDYAFTVMEVYNPTGEPQTFYSQDPDGNILTTVPMDWGQTVKIYSETPYSQETSRRLIPQVLAQEKNQQPYEIITGRDYEVATDGTIRTGPNGYVKVRIGDAYTKINNNTEFSIDKADPYLNWLERIYLDIWRYSKRNSKFQRKVPLSVLGVRG